MADATIEQREALGVASLIALSAMVRASGLPQSLLYAHVNFGAYQGESRPKGAPTPDVARATYTRAALRHRHERQRAFRAGHAGLLRSIRSVA